MKPILLFILLGISSSILLVGCAFSNRATKLYLVETIAFQEDLQNNIKEDSIAIYWKYNPKFNRGYNTEFVLKSENLESNLRAHLIKYSDTSFIMTNINADSRFHKIYVDFESTNALRFVLGALEDTVYRIEDTTFKFTQKTIKGDRIYLFKVKE